MLNLKNALRCGTVNLLVLVSCALVFWSETLRAQTNDYPGCTERTGSYQVSRATSGDDIACASGNFAIAIGAATAADSSSIAIGRNAGVTNANAGIAIGLEAKVDGIGANSTASGIAFGNSSVVTGEDSSSIGAFTRVGRSGVAHHRSTSIGFRATTTDHNQVAIGAAAGIEITPRGDTGLFNGAWWGRTQSYVFGGLAIAEDQIDGLEFTALTFNPAASGNLSQAERDAVVRYRAAVKAERDKTEHRRVLGVDGHGKLITLGAADGFGGGSSYDDAEVRGLVGNNRDAISNLRGMVGSNRDLAAQGVAMANALSAIPNTLSPGKKLFLGLGVGSFDGKSATAIGVTGKFGASTLLNAGFSSGGGESSTRLGIGWEW